MVLGAGGVGKSCLTVQFVQGIYMDTYDPTIEDSYNKEIEVDGRACNLEILDTAGVAQFTAMRELYIKNGQGFLLVYSVTDKKSLQELLSIREQITRIKGSSNVPMVLIGNKCDLTDERELDPEDGIEISKTWDKVPFYETSAMYKMNVDDAFVDIVRQIIRKEVQQQQQLLQEDENNKNDSSIKNKTATTNNVSNINNKNSNINNIKNSSNIGNSNTDVQNHNARSHPVQRKQQAAKPKKSKKKCVIL